MLASLLSVHKTSWNLLSAHAYCLILTWLHNVDVRICDTLNYNGMPLYLVCTFSVAVKENVHPSYIYIYIYMKCFSLIPQLTENGWEEYHLTPYLNFNIYDDRSTVIVHIWFVMYLNWSEECHNCGSVAL